MGLFGEECGKGRYGDGFGSGEGVKCGMRELGGVGGCWEGHGEIEGLELCRGESTGNWG